MPWWLPAPRASTLICSLQGTPCLRVYASRGRETYTRKQGVPWSEQMRVLALGAGNHQGILSSQGPRTRACHVTWNTAREQLHEAGLKPILPGQLDRRDTVQRQGQTHLRFPALGGDR